MKPPEDHPQVALFLLAPRALTDEQIAEDLRETARRIFEVHDRWHLPLGDVAVLINLAGELDARGNHGGPRRLPWGPLGPPWRG